MEKNSIMFLFEKESRKDRTDMHLRFNTRDKKPKVWNIAILSAIAVILVVILARDPEHIPLLALSIIIVIYMILTLVFLIIAFFQQLQYNPYSYNSIYYAGFSLFLFSVLITHIVAMIRMLRFPNVYDLSSVLITLVSSARNYMLLSAPFVLVFSVALFVSNISLLKHEGKRFQNFLGMILAVLMVAGGSVPVFLGLLCFRIPDRDYGPFDPDQSVCIVLSLFRVHGDRFDRDQCDRCEI